MTLPTECRRLVIFFIVVTGQTGISFRNLPGVSFMAGRAGTGGVRRLVVQTFEGAVAGTTILLGLNLALL